MRRRGVETVDMASTCSQTEPALHGWSRVGAIIAIATALGACKPAAKPDGKSSDKSAEIQVAPSAKKGTAMAADPLRQQFANARAGEAKVQFDQQQLAQAMTLWVEALKIDPNCPAAREQLPRLLSATHWSFPALELNCGEPVTQLAFSPPASLWVTLNGNGHQQTTVRWNLETARIEAALFPVPTSESRALILSPPATHIVIPRGKVTLLCDAVTLKPIRDLGELPEPAAAESLVTFSPDGLLLAHPSFVSESDHSLLWNIRDSSTGESIRISPPIPASEAAPMTVCLDRSNLFVLRADGSIWQMPVSPVEAIQTQPSDRPIRLRQAQFNSDGSAARAVLDRGPLRPPTIELLPFNIGEQFQLEVMFFAERFPWSRQPGLWSGFFLDVDDPAFKVDGKVLAFTPLDRAPIAVDSPISAIAFKLAKDLIFTGEDRGMVTEHRTLPAPKVSAEAPSQTVLDETGRLAALEGLSLALGGLKYDETNHDFIPASVEERMQAARSISPETLDALFPELDLRPVLAAILSIRAIPPTGDATAILTDRLARNTMPQSPSPELAALASTFHQGDDATVLAAIRSAGPKGPAAATALALALQSDHVPWIQASLAIAENLPDLLKRIAVSRIARLENRNADALSLWPDEFPDLTAIRLREDWDGWEQADFMPAFTEMKAWSTAELAAIDVGPDTTAEQRKAVAARLLDPATVASVGKPRFAAACLKAALAFSAHKEEFETTLKLTAMARNLGAAAEPCLRAEALAYTALGDYKNAHPRWIELITEHPVETHIPGDYAEAAYTAFENSDPGQAMQILTTGMHRFPRDGNFALRAGWVALLTGNSARAYQFLTTGRQIGFPPEKYENAVALLAIAASLVGATDDAAVYFQELLKIDPVWAEAKTLDTLDWPEELKSELRQFMR